MKKHLAFLLILACTTIVADEPRTLTIYGTVDPRLDVSFMSTYRGTNLDRIECSDMNPSTGRRKVKLAGLSKHVTTADYNITMPIDYIDANECGYEFVSIDLIMRRKYDDKSYSRFPIMGKYTSDYGKIDGRGVSPVYHGMKGGEGSAHFLGIPKDQTPPVFRSKKKYFRIVPNTTFACMTQNRVFEFERPKKEQELNEKYNPNGDFMCKMQMKLDTDGGQYHYQECTLNDIPNGAIACFTTTHPDFGVDELKNDSLHINIVIDESKCQLLKIDRFKVERVPDIFRELPKPSPSAMESLKSLF